MEKAWKYNNTLDSKIGESSKKEHFPNSEKEFDDMFSDAFKTAEGRFSKAYGRKSLEVLPRGLELSGIDMWINFEDYNSARSSSLNRSHVDESLEDFLEILFNRCVEDGIIDELLEG